MFIYTYRLTAIFLCGINPTFTNFFFSLDCRLKGTWETHMQKHIRVILLILNKFLRLPGRVKSNALARWVHLNIAEHSSYIIIINDHMNYFQVLVFVVWYWYLELSCSFPVWKIGCFYGMVLGSQIGQGYFLKVTLLLFFLVLRFFTCCSIFFNSVLQKLLVPWKRNCDSKRVSYPL